MAKTKRKWIILDWLLPDCLRAEDIPYDENHNIKTKIDTKISEAQHEVLDTLVHNLAESCYVEYIRTSGRVTNITTWTDLGKTIKIREEDFTYTGGQVSQIVEKQYDGSGLPKVTKTTAFARTGGLVTSETITVVYE